MAISFLQLTPARQRRHMILAGCAIICALIAYVLFGASPETWSDGTVKAEMVEWRISIALAYSALIFLAVTLAIGPLNALRRRPLSANSYLRRDVAIWAGILALAHVPFGASIHTDDLRFWTLWFMDMPMPGSIIPIQTGWYGLANFAGLVQLGIITLLLFISRDVMMLSLGIKRWKTLQRLSYVALISILIHGFAYHRVENRDRATRFIFLAIIGLTILLQIAGFIITLRKRHQQNQPVTLSPDTSIA